MYRQLSKDTNVVPSTEDWATYKAPEFDDGSYYQADSDEDEDDFKMDHDVGVFSTSALTPRHRMNRAIIAKQTSRSTKLGVASKFVLSEPIMIRTLSVLGTPNTAGARLNDEINLAGKSIGDEAVEILADILDEVRAEKACRRFAPKLQREATSREKTQYS